MYNSIASIRKAARNAERAGHGQWPFMDDLSPENQQRLMDLSRQPTLSGTVYVVEVYQGHRYLKYVESSDY